MKLLVRAVVTGFGLAMGSAIFKKIADHFGVGEEDNKAPDVNAQEGATDPGLRHQFS